MALLDTYNIVLPTKRARPGGQSFTNTFQPGTPATTAPGYRNHTEDLFATRIANDSRTLLNELLRHDPDASSAVFAFGTLCASSNMVLRAYDQNEVLSVEGIELGNKILNRLFNVVDYTAGYNSKSGMKQFLDELRYSTLLRGALGFELVINKLMEPDSLRLVDMSTINWEEKAPGVYKPIQKPVRGGDDINLDIPTFFTSRFHQNPTDVYSYSLFVSAINTIAARQQVINELYRIMQVTGYPRLDITVLEDIIMNSAPANLRMDPKARQQFVDTQIQSIRSQFTAIRSDQALVHTNAVTAQMINDKNPGASIQMKEVIDTLDSQNQAALKTMPSVVGKGSNANTASTETRLFAINCDSLNATIAGPISEALTLAARLAGFQGRLEASFTPIELRPTLELEPQLTMKSSRLKQDLSLGLIVDEEYHMDMYGRPPPPGAPKLSGTGFLDQQEANVDVKDISPNDDPNGAGLTTPGSQNAKSNRTKSGQTKPKTTLMIEL